MESSAKILIVDDDESLRFLYSGELREGGYDPIPAKTGKEDIINKDDFMSWAADAYLTKAPDLRQLKGTIRNLLVNRKKKVLTQSLIS
jgi:DNA-binding response OmpR family regulator